MFSQIQNLAFFKTGFSIFQLQAPGNPALHFFQPYIFLALKFTL